MTENDKKYKLVEVNYFGDNWPTWFPLVANLDQWPCYRASRQFAWTRSVRKKKISYFNENQVK